MPRSASARDHSLASAICPIAAEAWLSSSLRALLGSLAIVRPSAIAPEDTTTTLAPRLWSAAMSEASASSHTRLTAPRTPSTRSDEPTLTTMRLNRSREGSLTTIAGIRGHSGSTARQPAADELFSCSAARPGWQGGRLGRSSTSFSNATIIGSWETDRQDGAERTHFQDLRLRGRERQPVEPTERRSISHRLLRSKVGQRMPLMQRQDLEHR